MEGSIAETTFYEDPKNPSPDADQGGVNVHEHAKELCVNKLGQTMVVPPKALIVAAALPDNFLTNLNFIRKVNLTEILEEISYAQKNSNIEYAFWILAALQIPVIIILSVLVAEDFFGWNNRYEFNKPGFVETKEGIEMNRASISRNSITADASEDRPLVSKLQLKLLVGSTVAILYIYDGLQACFGYYLYLHSVTSSFSGINFHDEISSLNSCFWGLFAFGRLLSIGIATKLTPAFMLSINIIGCLCSIILILFFLQIRLVIYIGTALFALFLSSVYPNSVTLAETYINVTSFIASILVVGAAFGEMMVPHILDVEFDGLKAEHFLVSSLIMILLSCVFYIVVIVVGDSIIRQSYERSVMQIMKFLLCPPNEKEKVKEDSGQSPQVQT
ncbi:Sodium-dependent glucose transporter 1 [Armadillidium nasatum]|uniref:Sodium-dependent glucose transporter 1 n=1 Tax=Armadillidium nasatum TaxID=96803 RepID=A0A5N5TDX7_9CRUS|nr:Sodium-dependent glucose transporter 1 [Armadillidium nasatum]